MSIEFNCHVCGKLLRTRDDRAGRTASCPACGEKLTVPGQSGDDDSYRLKNEPVDDEEEVEGEKFDDEDDDEFERPPAARIESSGRSRSCPMCGERVSASAARCRCSEWWPTSIGWPNGIPAVAARLLSWAVSLAVSCRSARSKNRCFLSCCLAS